MKRECAWCGSTLGQVKPFESDRTTHGICHLCTEAVLARAEQSTAYPALSLLVQRPKRLRSNASRG
jgi:hypothetical protein